MPEGREHTLKERIAAATELAPAERRVAEFFAESGEQVAFLPAVKIAAALGVSNATVIRTAQRLGYAGLPDLKDELQAAALQKWRTPLDRVERSLDELAEDTEALPEQFMAVQARLLTEAGRALRPEDFARAVDLLNEADRIVTFAQAPGAGLAEYFTHGLRRFGRRALAIGRYHGETTEDLLELGPGDVLVVLAYMHVATPTVVLLDEARDQGLPSVLVTDTLALVLRGRYTVVLSAPRGEADLFPTSTVPLAVLEALLLGVGGRDRPRTRAAMRKRGDLGQKLA